MRRSPSPEKDFGPGDKIDRVFERYFSSRPTQNDGEPPPHSGLGLWIVRRNVEALGGRVDAANRTPTGLSIVNVLPGRVTSIREESGPVADVEVAVGETLLTARITRRSLVQLGIHVEQELYAMVKSVSFDHRSTGYA